MADDTMQDVAPVAPTPPKAPPEWMQYVPFVAAISATNYKRQRREYEFDVGQMFNAAELQQRRQQNEAANFYQQQQLFTGLTKQRSDVAGDLTQWMTKEAEAFSALRDAKEKFQLQRAMNPEASPEFLRPMLADVELAEMRWKMAADTVKAQQGRVTTIDDAMLRLIPSMRPPSQVGADQQMVSGGEEPAPDAAPTEEPAAPGDEAAPAEPAAPTDPWEPVQRTLRSMGLPAAILRNGQLNLFAEDASIAKQYQDKIDDFSKSFGVSLPVTVVDRGAVIDKMAAAYKSYEQEYARRSSKIQQLEVAKSDPKDVQQMEFIAGLAEANGDTETAATMRMAARAPEEKREAILNSAIKSIQDERKGIADLRDRTAPFAREQIRRAGALSMLSPEEPAEEAAPAAAPAAGVVSDVAVNGKEPPSGLERTPAMRWWLAAMGIDPAKGTKEQAAAFEKWWAKYRTKGR